MKKRYFITLLSLLLLWILFLINDFSSHPRIAYGIQISSIFIAFFVAIIALHASDKPKQKIRIKNNVYANKKKGEYDKKDFNKKLLETFIDYPDLITAHQIYFELTNVTGITLEQPTLTFKLPINRKHPNKGKNCTTYTFSNFNSNLFNSTKDIKMLDTGDSFFISNSNLPFWNNNDTHKFWIRMTLDHPTNKVFEITISINAKNANGITKEVKIDPDKILYKDIVR